MKRLFIAVFITLALVAPIKNASAAPVELGLLTPIQLAGPGSNVDILRLGLLYTVNNNVTGLDFNIIASKTSGNFLGVQFGLVGLVSGSATGVQLNMVTLNDGKTTGLQWGVFNKTNSMSGLQLGLINMAKNLNGVQIGLINFADNSMIYKIFPIINLAF